VLYDGAVQDRVNDRRKTVNPGEVKRDELVEGVTGNNAKDRKGTDIDDDIIDRVVGHETKKPGADAGKTKDIVVDSSNLPKASSPSGGGGGEKKKEMSNKSSSASEEKAADKKKGGKKSDNPMDGLEL